MNSSNNGYGFDAVYQAFNATPGYFLKDDSGELYWGTTTDEMKEALTTLHDWYEKGLINPEVGTTTNGDNGALDTATRIPSVTTTTQTGRHIRCTPTMVSGISI